MATQLEIYRIALSHLRAQTVAAVDAESNEAYTFGLFWDIARQGMLSDHPYRFARKVGALTESTGVTHSMWEYVYNKPTGLLSIYGVFPDLDNYPNYYSDDWWFQNEKHQAILEIDAPYESVICSDNNEHIVTNVDDAYCAYSFDQTDTSKYTVEFTLALSYMLAYLGATNIIGNDRKAIEMKKMLNEEVQRATNAAKANDCVNQNINNNLESQFIRVRQI